VKYEVRYLPVDDGMMDDFARELGYASKADLEAKVAADRAKLTPEQRTLADEIARDIERQAFGLA
jgi:hypothetical protein